MVEGTGFENRHSGNRIEGSNPSLSARDAKMPRTGYSLCHEDWIRTMSLENHYNKIYSENEKTFGDGKPEKVVSDITKYKSSGSVLELGAGEGRNSLFLAGQGFEVTAQDISQVGIEKLTKAAQEKSLNIQTEVKDIRTLDSDQNYDIFVCTYVLHHLSREDAVLLVKQIQEHTNADGLNAVTTFTENGDFYKNNPSTANFYPEEGELRNLYADWEVLEYEEVENQAFAKRPDGSPMVNVSAKIIARKPKSNEKNAHYSTAR